MDSRRGEATFFGSGYFGAAGFVVGASGAVGLVVEPLAGADGMVGSGRASAGEAAVTASAPVSAATPSARSSTLPRPHLSMVNEWGPVRIPVPIRS